MEATEPTARPAVVATTDPKGKASAQRLTPISATGRGRDGERCARAAASGGVSIDRSMAAAARSDQAGATKHDTRRPRLRTTTEVRVFRVVAAVAAGLFCRPGSPKMAALAGQATLPLPMSARVVRWGL